MNKKIILLFLLTLTNGSFLSGEGFADETQAFTWDMGLKPMDRIKKGFWVMALSGDGALVKGTVTLKETREKCLYHEIKINGHKIRAADSIAKCII